MNKLIAYNDTIHLIAALRPIELSVLLMYLWHADSSGIARPSNARLAKFHGHEQQRHVRDARAALVARGLMEPAGKHGRFACYKVIHPWPARALVPVIKAPRPARIGTSPKTGLVPNEGGEMRAGTLPGIGAGTLPGIRPPEQVRDKSGNNSPPPPQGDGPTPLRGSNPARARKKKSEPSAFDQFLGKWPGIANRSSEAEDKVVDAAFEAWLAGNFDKYPTLVEVALAWAVSRPIAAERDGPAPILRRLACALEKMRPTSAA